MFLNQHVPNRLSLPADDWRQHGGNKIGLYRCKRAQETIILFSVFRFWFVFTFSEQIFSYKIEKNTKTWDFFLFLMAGFKNNWGKKMP